jgi:benzylsuccinate CoA-transferase BbsE subunit
VLDLCDQAGHREFLELVRSADVLIESFDPGYLESIGLGIEVLSTTNPSLVHTSITAFGSMGPKARWAATDLT